MAYMRHTGQWWEIFQGLRLDQCFEEIKGNSLLQTIASEQSRQYCFSRHTFRNANLLTSSFISLANFHPSRSSAVFIASIPVLSIKRAVLSRFFPFAW